MLSFAEARERVLRDVEPLSTERVSVPQSLGRVLAESITAPTPIPAFDHSAMDGYAVAIASFEGAGPWTLPVHGESQTGHVAPALAPNSACRIFTGATLPAGADAIIMQENAERDGDRVTFTARPEAGAHIRRAGEELRAGAIALERGTRLSAYALGLAAALDRVQLLVHRRPRVTVLCTGDELRAPGSPPREATIPESNGVSIAAAAQRIGCHAELAPLTGDDALETERAIVSALPACDLLVTIGGVSVGDHDVVKPALERAGATLDFWKVAIKPGKPLAMGRCGTTLILGLPGNPVSAQVTFALFGVPLLRALQGDARPTPPLRSATLTHAIHHKPGRRSFERATLDGATVTPLRSGSSGSPVSMAWANALVVVAEESAGVEAGATVDVIALDDI